MNRIKTIAISGFIALTSTAFSQPVQAQIAERCTIIFGRGGASLPISNDRENNFRTIDGPWDFIRETSGNCHFEVFNENSFSGRRVLYGTDVSKRIRIGAKGAQNKNGCRSRSLRIIPRPRRRCSITLGDNRVSQTFLGQPTNLVNNISGWSFIRETTGRCTFTVRIKL
ncbi:hypothetical protein NIES267_34240 [Calothrix parasitica NIES-267]|uniref:Beta/gamma crystallin 'Greek key' domain-containing protein n=1 Tax=Calothrix parasitica NIES-267 TaxID=1973488 RepID=A0A1Z4LRQ3_9CYAN|nr:hypothetical protein NIES267_34240 [Calothrix parasitica NIES-267]